MNRLQELYELRCQEEGLKAQQKIIKEKILIISDKIANETQFPSNKKTAYHEDHGFKVKVERKEEFKWDQEALNKARLGLGDSLFLTLFKYEWKHASKPAIDHFLTGEQRKPIQDALTIKTSFVVSIEKGVEKEAA